ncbi:beta-lactamase family protein [Streptomyces kaniharaensis]|uniref:Beta-lactamase family protein n=1 Tax=Streptomyces kaniharaensis TaxID=212423 RepID=A0A6N7L4X4_9ACTN|nr:serine hydrolase domain-containing protein [Streptomyces kaniharaensis]MQS16963.1 beta-lactamase family protein [Streptomyces kaniharaensis]
MRRSVITSLFCVTLLTGAAAPATGAVPTHQDGHRRGCHATAPHDDSGREALRIAEQAKEELDLNSVLLRVTEDGRDLVTAAVGESMTGVPADPAMHFRAGSVAIAYLGTTLLQLVDEGEVGLDDPVGRWLPELPHAGEITLRMLASSDSGLVDYVRDPDFVAALEADPFRQWTAEELVGISTSQPLWYEPGTNWNYSHANFVILGAALEKITGTRLDHLLEERIMGPLGLHQTRNGFTPDIPAPVLHAFTSERGTYEESTFWNPSWTTAPGAVLTTDICDLATSAVGIGSGRLLSPQSRQELLDPGTVGLGGPTDTCPATVCQLNTEARHYGMGVVVSNDWVVQNPSFFGYAAVQAYLRSNGLAIAVSTTKGRNTPDGNTAQIITNRIAAALAPDHPLPPEV